MIGSGFFIGRPGWVRSRALDLALLINREDDGVSGRVDIEADDVAQFVDKLRVGGRA